MKGIACVSLFLLMIMPCQAVMIAGPDGTANATAPADDKGWSYVGRLNASSAVYIGNQWFLTARHVDPNEASATVSLNGASYPIDSNSWTVLTTPIVGTPVDLQMFRVTSAVGLNNLTVSASIRNRSTLSMVGYGRERGGPHLDTGGSTNGYYWGALSGVKRWGMNEKGGAAAVADYGYGITEMFSTDWDNSEGEAQAVEKDSGGGVFVQNGSDWELAGIMLVVDQHDDNGNVYNEFGDKTYIANIPTYRSQILDVMAQVPASITNLFFTSSGTVANVEWDAKSDVTYQVQSTSELSSSNTWLNVGNPVVGPNNTQTNEATSATQFFRVVIP